MISRKRAGLPVCAAMAALPMARASGQLAFQTAACSGQTGCGDWRTAATWGGGHPGQAYPQAGDAATVLHPVVVSELNEVMDLFISGGSVSIPGELRVLGSGLLSAGGITGNLVLQGGFGISSTGTVFLGGSPRNQALLLHQQGSLNLPFGTLFRNEASGTYDIAGDVMITGVGGTGTFPEFLNMGVIRKSAGSGQAVFEYPVEVDTSGTVESQSGTLVLGPGTSTGGMYIAAAGASIDMCSNQTRIMVGTLSGSGDGRVFVAAGGLVGSGTLNFPGDLFEWRGGALAGEFTNSGVINMVGSSDKILVGMPLNIGTLRHAQGALKMSPGAALTVGSGGVYDLVADVAINQGTGMGSAPALAVHGTLRKSGGSGTATIASPVSVQAPGLIEVESGRLSILGPLTLSASSLLRLEGGELETAGPLHLSMGRLEGSGLVANPVTNQAEVAPGPGGLVVQGGYSQSAAGELEISIGGAGPGMYSSLEVGDAAMLGGSLTVSLSGGFVPVRGQTFTIITAGSVNGSFSTVNLPALAGGGSLRVQYLPSSVVVSVCYANCDGSTQAPILNVADFSCFLQKFAGGGDYANCDQSTQPPTLNVADFSCFLQSFAAGCN